MKTILSYENVNIRAKNHDISLIKFYLEFCKEFIISCKELRKYVIQISVASAQSNTGYFIPKSSKIEIAFDSA